MEIILASNSPRRKKILSELGYKFIVIPSGVNEENKDNLLPEKYVLDVCERKGFSVWKKHKDYAVISGDTIIDFNNIDDFCDLGDFQDFAYFYYFNYFGDFVDFDDFMPLENAFMIVMIFKQ